MPLCLWKKFTTNLINTTILEVDLYWKKFSWLYLKNIKPIVRHIDSGLQLIKMFKNKLAKIVLKPNLAMIHNFVQMDRSIYSAFAKFETSTFTWCKNTEPNYVPIQYLSSSIKVTIKLVTEITAVVNWLRFWVHCILCTEFYKEIFLIYFPATYLLAASYDIRSIISWEKFHVMRWKPTQNYIDKDHF